MDGRLYDAMRQKIRLRAKQDRERATTLHEVARTFRKYVNEATGIEHAPCELGVLDERGQFIAGDPVVHDRMTMPFALRISFSNADGSIAFRHVVRFVLKHQGHFCNLACLETGEEADIVPSDFLSSKNTVQSIESVKLLDQPLKRAVEEFVNG